MSHLKLLTTLFFLGIQLFAYSQEEKKSIFQRIKEKTKATSEQRAENTGDKIGNKVGDKADAAVDSLLSGAWFKKKKKTDAAKDEKKTENDPNKKTDLGEGNNSTKSANAPIIGKATGKYDFVAGEKTLYFDDFSRVDIGDFPADINTNASGEIVTIEGKEGKWLNLTKNGNFLFDAIKTLPDNFTLEFNAGIQNDPTNNYSGFGLIFST
ncbi:MAG: hypothetical protein ACOVNO_08825, partial [Sediminibacterium sp.]